GLSGILTNQEEIVIQSYTDKFVIDPVAEREEWCRISGVKIATN
ncbi:50S ribosomal protein L11 methyltransferase, partial [Enterobacter hormaechei]|nr:50S ribosomal protein L11 methyltransferase [Enterobacter hormaechei]